MEGLLRVCVRHHPARGVGWVHVERRQNALEEYVCMICLPARCLGEVNVKVRHVIMHGVRRIELFDDENKKECENEQLVGFDKSVVWRRRPSCR